jgi:hypothetical protein
MTSPSKAVVSPRCHSSSKGDGTWTTTSAATPSWATSLLFLAPDTLSVLYAKGNGEWQPLVTTLSEEAKQAVATGLCAVADYNADGRHDISYGCGSGSTTLSWFYSMGNGNWRLSTTTRPDLPLNVGKHLVGDFDGSGTADMVLRRSNANTLPVLFARNENGERLITITQGHDAITRIDSSSLTLTGNYTRGETVTAPYVVTTPALRVVSKVEEDMGSSFNFKTVQYSYDSAILELGTGRGFAGFSSVMARDPEIDTNTYTKYRPD